VSVSETGFLPDTVTSTEVIVGGPKTYHWNGIVIANDDTYCVSLFPGQYSGTATLVHNEDSTEFRDRLYRMSEVVVTVARKGQRIGPFHAQHRVVFIEGLDGLWRVAPNDEFTASLIFTPVVEGAAWDTSLGESVLASCRARDLYASLGDKT
jgi:hypothetical protein